jgi:hypothetical protein
VSVNLDAIAAGIAARRAHRRQLGIGLWSVLTERRVLAAMILQPDILERCVEIETDDFADLAHRAIFEALRNIQARGDDPTPEAIDEDLRKAGLHAVTSRHVDDVVCGEGLGGPAPYVAAPGLMQLERDTTWLRTLNLRRRKA